MKKLSVFISLCILVIGVSACSNAEYAEKNGKGVIEAFDGTYEASVEIVDNEIIMEVSAKTSGWVAIGFKSEKTHGMKGAEFFLFSMKDGTPLLAHHYGDTTSSHVPVSEAGSKAALLSWSEEDGVTSFKAARRIDAAGEHLATIKQGEEVEVFYAYADSDSFDLAHSKKGHKAIVIP